MTDYSIVVPVYNEAEIVNEFYNQLIAVISKIEDITEIIFSTGGNTDNTLDILKELALKDNRVKIIKMSARFDYQAALTAGLDYASGEAVISMDGDLQHPPKLIPQMICEWKNGNDIVYTIREDPKEINLFLKTGSKFFYFLMKLLTKVDFEENAADFRLLSRKALNAYKQFAERKRYIPGIVSLLGFNKTGIRYVSHPREKGKSKFSFSRLLTLALDGIFSFSNVPIRLITFLGFIMSSLAFIYLLYVIIWGLLNPHQSMGWASLLATVLFFSGLQILILGVIGEYIGRIYEESKFRPLYIVEELVGFNEKQKI
jgi:dolichol-phosphate mannosyltransferase